MKIKFTHDFRGKLTGELFYTEGTEIDVDDDTGRELVALHHAVDVTPAPVAPPKETDNPAPKSRRSSKSKASSSKSEESGDNGESA